MCVLDVAYWPSHEAFSTRALPSVCLAWSPVTMPTALPDGQNRRRARERARWRKRCRRCGGLRFRARAMA